MNKIPAPRNRTIYLTEEEKNTFKSQLIKLNKPVDIDFIKNKIINQNIFDVFDYLPENFVDLLFLDPPYNLDKQFNTTSFSQRSINEYSDWMETWLPKLIKTLKKNSSIYICGDWRSSAAIQLIAEKYFIIQNRITFEREKGRGAKKNWKNCSEDIWFCTLSKDYTFNIEAVKLKRKVLAPYRDEERNPKDWLENEDGKFRLSYPSNIWTDITIPFWSMPENTEHPTQKPEKLMAKIILASSNKGDLIFDPFAGSGSTLVTAKKLSRNYVGIEIDEEYCCLALKRLKLADEDNTIQGYSDGVFWERNSLKDINKKTQKAQTLWDLDS